MNVKAVLKEKTSEELSKRYFSFGMRVLTIQRLMHEKALKSSTSTLWVAAATCIDRERFETLNQLRSNHGGLLNFSALLR